MEQYRVNLDVYNGPLDLLLYLIRREEVDIYDIPIAHVTEQYCRYVDVLKRLDPNLAGEFLVTAATLMEIKSRMLLPSPPPEEGSQEGLGDPRAELVRQLLEYKAFKDAAGQLRESGQQQALRHPRQPVRPGPTEHELDMDDVQVWHLLEAFNALMAAIGKDLVGGEVISDDTPIALHAEDILDRLARDGNMTFGEIFAGREERAEIVGLFLAMLELIRQGKVVVRQQKTFGKIYVFLSTDGNPPAETSEGDTDHEEPQHTDATSDPS